MSVRATRETKDVQASKANRFAAKLLGRTWAGPSRGSSDVEVDLVSVMIGCVGSACCHRSVVGPGNRNTGLIAKESVL